MVAQPVPTPTAAVGDRAHREASPKRATTQRSRTAARDEPTREWPPILDGLPALDLSPRERVYTDLARRLFQRGLKALREGSYEAATEHFFEALEVDPGNVDARYNLACSVALAGDRVAAVTLLTQLRDGGCVACLGKLLKARRDPDFDAIRKHKSFATVVDDVESELPESTAAATEVAAWVASTRAAELPLSIDARAKVVLGVGCPTCKGGSPELSAVRGTKAVRTWIERKRRAFSGGIASAAAAECKPKARCCDFAPPSADAASPDVLFLAELCFRIEAGVTTSLSKITLHRYPASDPADLGPLGI